MVPSGWFGIVESGGPNFIGSFFITCFVISSPVFGLSQQSVFHVVKRDGHDIPCCPFHPGTFFTLSTFLLGLTIPRQLLSHTQPRLCHLHEAQEELHHVDGCFTVINVCTILCMRRQVLYRALWRNLSFEEIRIFNITIMPFDFVELCLARWTQEYGPGVDGWN